LLVDVPGWKVHKLEFQRKEKHPEIEIVGQRWVVRVR